MSYYLLKFNSFKQFLCQIRYKQTWMTIALTYISKQGKTFAAKPERLLGAKAGQNQNTV